MSTNSLLTRCKQRAVHYSPRSTYSPHLFTENKLHTHTLQARCGTFTLLPWPFNENKDLGKYLGKVFAHNSHDFLCVRYEIRQTYAVCLILLFIQRFADVMLSVAIHLAMCPGGFICWSCFELFGSTK